MRRRILTIAVILPLTLIGIPLQWLARRSGLGIARTIPRFYHRALLALWDVRLHVHGEPVTDGAILIVANHVSWLDIPVIGSLRHVSFVAKSEIAGWPLVGTLARLQPTLFVERERRSRTGAAAAAIAATLGDGDAVVLFAEGTSSDGNRVLPFRSALVGAARDVVTDDGARGRVWVQPLSIAYTRLGGLPMGRRGRPRVAWYGDMDFLPHISAFLGSGPLDVDIVWGEPVAFDGSSDRKVVTRKVESIVRRDAAEALAGRRRVFKAGESG